MPKSLYLIDGHAQIYRSYYAPFRNLTSPAGEPTRATYVFCSTLFNLIRHRRPDYLAMVLDVTEAPVFRQALYPDYKAHRDPPPEDLPVQAERIVRVVEALGIPVLRKEGFEADDLLATLARRFAGDELEVYLVSRDKDLEQLIDRRVFMYDPSKDEVIDASSLLATKGYAPAQAIDVQTLAGDSVDNIPGVTGVGVKTAAKLIQEYGSAEAVLANADRLSPKQCENVKAFGPRLPVTRQLVTLRTDVDVDFDLESARFGGVPVERVRPIFEQLGFHRLVEQLEEFSPPAARQQTLFAVSPAPGAAAGRYKLVDTVEKLADLAGRMANLAEFAFDTETTGLNPVAADLVGLALAWEPGTAYYVPVRAAEGAVVPVEAVRRLLGPLLENPAIRKVGQNIKFDCLALRQVGITVAGVAFDTMIASFLLDPLRSHGLDALAQDLLGHTMIPITDLIGRGREQITIDHVDVARVCEYAAEDADFTWQLKEVLEPRIIAGPFRSLFEQTEMPLVDVLTEMEHNGVALDTALLRRMSGELADRTVDLTRQIHRAAGHAFNVDSTRQLATVLFDEQNLPVIRKTKTGRSTDAATLEALADQTDNPVPRLLLEYRELSKLKGTYVDPLPQMVCPRTGRVHASFHQTEAVTGRLSSSDPNLQNIPVRTELGRRIRAAFVAGAPDLTLLVADYSQIELRVLAHFCRDEALLTAFRAGQDIHTFVAGQVNGVPPEQVTLPQRSAAKAVNFGIIYGQTAFGLAKALGITQTAAQDFIDRYNRRYPGIRSFVARCVEETREKGYAETILGRRRPIPELRSRNRQQVALGERLAVNTVIQGSAADLIKRAMIDIHNDIKMGKLATRMLIQVHDELVFEVRQADVPAHEALIRQKMTFALPLDVPIVVDVGVGPNWLAAK